MVVPSSAASRWGAYRSGALADDVVAAAIVTILLVPQSLAYALLAGLPPVVLMMSGVNDIDFTGLEALVQLTRELNARGVVLHLYELKGPVGDRLVAAGLSSWLTGQVFRTQHEARLALDAGVDMRLPGA